MCNGRSAQQGSGAALPNLKNILKTVEPPNNTNSTVQAYASAARATPIYQPVRARGKSRIPRTTRAAPRIYIYTGWGKTHFDSFCLSIINFIQVLTLHSATRAPTQDAASPLRGCAAPGLWGRLRGPWGVHVQCVNPCSYPQKKNVVYNYNTCAAF